jgi:hypothetical protein
MARPSPISVSFASPCGARRVVGHVPVAAMHLDRVVGGAGTHLGREELRLGRGQAIVATLVLQPRGAPDERPGRLDLGRHVGDHERNALERADRPAELLARLRVRDGASRAAWASPTANAPMLIRPPSRMARNVLNHSPARRACWRPGSGPFEQELAVADACRPSLSSSRPTETGRVSRHDEGADLGRAVVPGSGPRRDDVGPAWPAFVMALPPSMTHEPPSGPSS